MNTSSTAAEPGTRYDKTTIALHWTVAALVLLLWVIGQLIDAFPRGDPRALVRSIHVTLGVVFGLVLIARIAWRLGWGRSLPAHGTGTSARLAVGVHRLLYLLLIGVLAAGLALVWVRGDTLYGVWTLPSPDPGNRALRRTLSGLHELAANAVLVVAALHAAAAFAHKLLGDASVLARMRWRDK